MPKLSKRIPDVTTLSISGPVIANCSGQDVICFGGSDGTATVDASGGTGSYTFDWGAFGSTQTMVGLAVGTYPVTVTDSLGCLASCSTTISEPTELVAQCSSIDGDCSNGNLGEGCANATGGTPGYTYLWSNGETTDCIENLIDGQYCVIVTDASGCTDTCCFTISTDPGYVINVNEEICDGDSIFLEGAWQFGADDYTDNYISSGGCDSVVTTTVSLLDTYFTQESLTLMIGDSAFLEGDWQHVAGLYYDTLESVITGCDSRVETDFQYSPVGIIQRSVDVRIFPNPVSTQQTITAQFSEVIQEIHVSVIDMSG
ncbi:MAG: hypothetical protein ACI9FU_000688 [Granulosicoccus sp.]|jgi:hypothetical protein